MKYVVLVSHGTFAQGLHSVLKMLADIIGGSPLTNALDVLAKAGMLERTRAYGGMNLPMALTAALTVKEELKKRFPGLCCSVYGGDIWAVDSCQDERIIHDEQITGTKAVEKAADSGIFDNIGVHKLLYMGNPEEIQGARLWLKENMPEVNAACSSPNYLEVMKEGVGKALGMKAVCNYLGFECSQAVAFGDGYNDLDMLCAAGRGYAMGNAPEGVRKAAPFQTAANDADGIALALQACFPGDRF